jgi:hypothetical protein
MQKPIILLFILVTGLVQAQTKADTLAGKWKYMGAMKTQSIYKTDPSWYKKSNATPKFEFVEFTKKGGCTIKEKDKKASTAIYTLNKDELVFGGISYKIRSINAKDLTILRSYYIVTGADGKETRVDEEQISFQKVK